MRYLKYIVIFLVVASATFLAIGFLSPSVTYETTVLVDKPVAHSFSVFNNPFNAKKWLPGFVSMRPISGLPNQVGSKYEMVFEENGEEFILQEKMTGFERNKLFAFDMSNEFLVSKVKIIFEEEDGKTRITSFTETIAKNFIFRSLFPFMKSQFQERERESYAKLKRLIESQDYHNDLLKQFSLNQG